MLINSKIGNFTLNKFMELLVTQKLTINHFKLPNNQYNVELINLHVPNIGKTKFVHIIYYIILYPCYLSLIKEFCAHNLIKINECTIQPDNIIDPLNYCNNVYIPVLHLYGFECDINTLKNKFVEGIVTYQTIQIFIKHKIIIPEIFFTQIDYNTFLNHMILSIMAAEKSVTQQKQNIIIEQYMVGLALLFKYSNNKFTTQHFNKIISCKNVNIIRRIIKYIKINPHKFDIKQNMICIDNDFITEDIKNIIVNEYLHDK